MWLLLWTRGNATTLQTSLPDAHISKPHSLKPFQDSALWAGSRFYPELEYIKVITEKLSLVLYMKIYASSNIKIEIKTRKGTKVSENRWNLHPSEKQWK